MSRRPRIHVDGFPLHIVQRGHNREPCFFADRDYSAYRRWLAEALADAQCELHAYALMSNHVHLLVTPAQAKLVPRLLIALGRRYVQYINATYNRSGTLWESRYKSSLIDTETYLLACMRYIDLNPVRAGIVANPAEYRWTSCRTNGYGARDDLVKPHAVYRQLGEDAASRQAVYRRMLGVELEDAVLFDIRRAIGRGAPLGTPRFREALGRALGRPCVARSPGRPRKDARPVDRTHA